MLTKNESPMREHGAGKSTKPSQTEVNNTQVRSQPYNPASIASEKAVIGAILENDDLIMPVVVNVGLRAADFFLSDHRRIFGAMLKLWEETGHIDLILVWDRLGSGPQDGATLSDCVRGVIVHPDHVIDHVKIIRDKAQRRALLRVGEWLPKVVNDPSPADALIEQAIQKLEAISSVEVTA